MCDKTEKWTEKDTYWVSNSEQLSEYWFKLRNCRITGSKIGPLVDHSPFPDSSPINTAREIAGVYKKTFSVRSQTLMQNGVITEPYAREWYSKMIKKDIQEYGLSIPKWDLRLGASVDGVIDSDNICEIKVPYKMYTSLDRHRKYTSSGVRYGKFYHKHIIQTHYDQMQMGMAVLGATKCHYIVYMPKEDDRSTPKDVYIEIVHFNPDYWDIIYKEAIDMYDEYILPLMEKYNIKRIDP
jgi:hypothetical protein